jgi:predicted flap endonuclease-1-like 5' DNA nuclease
MNQTSSAPTETALSNGTDFTALLTSAHLIWLAVLAMLVVVAIVYGVRAKHRRDVAERQVIEHAEEAGIRPAADARQPAPPPPPPPPPAPVAAAADINGPAARPVTLLKGLGPKVAARLGELGVTNVGQLAALDHDAAARLDAQLGAFQGRMERDRWIEQARFLAADDVTGFEAVFGRL